jgi:hypothetical protein
MCRTKQFGRFGVVMTAEQCYQLYKDLGMGAMPEPWVDTKHPLWILWCEYSGLNELEW